MQNKIVVITGANSGIGKATAVQLAQKGAHVVMVCRSQEKGEAALQEIITATGNKKVDLLLCDLAAQESIKQLGENIRQHYDKIDVLINNAGGIFGKRQLSPEGLEYTFALNHMGYFLTTHELLDLLRAGDMKRIINVSSLAHKFVSRLDWDNIQGEQAYGQLYNYGLSKLFNIWFTQSLSKMLVNEGITVNCLHPGTVNTGFGRSAGGFFKSLVSVGARFLSSPKSGAATSVFLATAPEVQGVSGCYYSNKKQARISKLAQNEDYAQQLWEISMQLGKLVKFGTHETP